ncbi:hypothetical protein AVEN_194539-1 [Araneus ventricosus]|uniref:Uncharacterized protein n=1 Tax=Araneus ventricosus TaxID=182803 RepID=A0A4Y2A6D2_ARAVE|nr:hypothetical protein AVEN_194539-1 [Araneus ventricosus]
MLPIDPRERMEIKRDFFLLVLKSRFIGRIDYNLKRGLFCSWRSESLHRICHGDLILGSRVRGGTVPGSKRDSIEDGPVARSGQHPPAGVARKLGECVPVQVSFSVQNYEIRPKIDLVLLQRKR